MRASSLSISLALVTAGFLGSGCNAPTVWDAEVPSPDGQYIAIANTVQNGGFGTDSIDTIISLQQANIPKTRTIVLAFDCNGPVPHPYVLDDVANAGGTINLKVHWVTPSHLDVTYHGNPTIDFQAVKCQGIVITLHEL